MVRIEPGTLEHSNDCVLHSRCAIPSGPSMFFYLKEINGLYKCFHCFFSLQINFEYLNYDFDFCLINVETDTFEKP